jgi:hypothetical protein
MAGDARESVDSDKAMKARANIMSMLSQIFGMNVIFRRSEDSELKCCRTKPVQDEEKDGR